MQTLEINLSDVGNLLSFPSHQLRVPKNCEPWRFSTASISPSQRSNVRYNCVNAVV